MLQIFRKLFETSSAQIAFFQLDGNCRHYVRRKSRNNVYVWRNAYTKEALAGRLAREYMGWKHDGRAWTIDGGSWACRPNLKANGLIKKNSPSPCGFANVPRKKVRLLK